MTSAYGWFCILALAMLWRAWREGSGRVDSMDDQRPNRRWRHTKPPPCAPHSCSPPTGPLMRAISGRPARGNARRSHFLGGRIAPLMPGSFRSQSATTSTRITSCNSVHRAVLLLRKRPRPGTTATGNRTRTAGRTLPAARRARAPPADWRHAPLGSSEHTVIHVLVGRRLPGDIAINDVLIAGVAALDHKILAGSGESRLADERGEKFLRAAGAMPRLAEGDHGIPGKGRDDVAGCRDPRQAVGRELTGGRPRASGQHRERHHEASGQGGFYRFLSNSLSGPSRSTSCTPRQSSGSEAEQRSLNGPATSGPASNCAAMTRAHTPSPCPRPGGGWPT